MKNKEKYLEQIKISESDRMFLEYIKDDFKYIARDEDGQLYVYKECGNRYEFPSVHSLSLNVFRVEFPMVKWEDDESWLIDDLKKLETIKEYKRDYE